MLVDSYEACYDKADKETRWTRPFSIPQDTLFSLIRSKQSALLCRSVRNLWLWDRVLRQDFLSTCSDIENLWLWADFESVPVAEIHLNRPLKRLHGTLEGIFGFDSKIDFSQPLFSSMTHLEIFTAPREIDLAVWSALTRLPHLTHLAFDVVAYLPMCHALLPTWQTLRVLVILFQVKEATDVDGDLLQKCNVTELADDPRLVFVTCYHYLEDWVSGAHMGGQDFWSQAENHIAKRKSGKFSGWSRYIADLDATPLED
ncbi:hypothetical protein C8R45DRAFT_1223642 [Mycena sanguinolenta]|nr:hypothetical protein C8R45DRAFT_1223642 [Mycena sanguinolenta]